MMAFYLWNLSITLYGSKSMDQWVENLTPFFAFEFLAKLAKFINFGMHSIWMIQIWWEKSVILQHDVWPMSALTLTSRLEVQVLLLNCTW